MPVMVTGVENVVGRRAVDLLLAAGGEVRVFVQAAAADASNESRAGVEGLREELRGLRCKVAHGFADDEAHVETALEQVHTVLHLVGRPQDDPDAYLDRTATVIGAAIGAGCKRLVLLSDLAVDAPGDNAWLDALVEAEDMAAHAPLESVVLRAALIMDSQDGLTRALAGVADGIQQLPESGEHWPIPAGAVAATAVMADAERDVDTSLHVVVPLAGPAAVATADLPTHARGLGAAAQEAVALTLNSAVLDLLSRNVWRPDDAIGGTITD